MAAFTLSAVSSATLSAVFSSGAVRNAAQAVVQRQAFSTLWSRIAADGPSAVMQQKRPSDDAGRTLFDAAARDAVLSVCGKHSTATAEKRAILLDWYAAAIAAKNDGARNAPMKTRNMLADTATAVLFNALDASASAAKNKREADKAVKKAESDALIAKATASAEKVYAQREETAVKAAEKTFSVDQLLKAANLQQRAVLLELIASMVDKERFVTIRQEEAAEASEQPAKRTLPPQKRTVKASAPTFSSVQRETLAVAA